MWPAAAAGAGLALWTGVSAWLPELPLPEGVVPASAVALALVAALQAGLLPLSDLRRALPLVAVAALAAAVALTLLGFTPGVNVAKVVFASALGLWLAGGIARASWVVIVAGAVTVVDIVSVYSPVGPTRTILEQGPRVVGWFTVALAWPGYAVSHGYTALGVADLIFFAFYLGAARRFSLRLRASAVVMSLSFLASIGAGIWLSAVPALPLLSLAFVAVNADLLWQRSRETVADGARSQDRD